MKYYLVGSTRYIYSVSMAIKHLRKFGLGSFVKYPNGAIILNYLSTVPQYEGQLQWDSKGNFVFGENY